MKKIFWRVFVAFGAVLLFFTILIGLMFTRFNRTNIVGAYKQQLGDLADGVVTRTSQAVKDSEADEFMDYLRAMEDFGKMQNVDIWIVADESSKHKLSDTYTNVQMDGLDIPKETEGIIQAAFQGKKKSYSDYDEIYQTVMLHLAVPVRDKSGDVSGAVVVSGPMEMQENTVIQYEKYMLICVMVGAFLALLLSFFFSRQLVRPIIRIKEAALVLAAGNYAHKTGIRRKDEFREDLEQSRRDFFSNVSHELRTPIAVMKGYADTLVAGYVTDETKQKEYLQRIQSECNGMEHLVSDLLILSRMQNPDYELNVEVLNVIAVAQDAMRGMRILMQEKNLTGNVTYDDECSLMKGDYDRVRQLFTVLLQNAVKYSDEGTEITMHVAKEEGLIVTTVRDFGIVIPESEWENVFEKFYRASSHGEKEGSGLGLVVAKNIVSRHGGHIFVRSDEKNGTIFTIEFPETSENIS